MTIPITLFKTQVENLIPGLLPGEATDINRFQQIRQATADFSRIRPDITTVDVTGDGGRYYAINSTNFPGYVDNFSRIRSIQYPNAEIAADEVPQYLEPEDWSEDYYDDSNVRYLFLPNHAPAATEEMRIQFSAFFTWVAGSMTVSPSQEGHGFSANDYVYEDDTNIWIGDSLNLMATHQVTVVTDVDNFTAAVLETNVPPEVSFFTICNRVACLLCTEIAARYSRTSDSTIAADSVNHPTRALMFSDRAKEFCAKWEEAMGIGKFAEEGGSYLPASEFVDFDTFARWPRQREFLHHDSETR